MDHYYPVNLSFFFCGISLLDSLLCNISHYADGMNLTDFIIPLFVYHMAFMLSIQTLSFLSRTDLAYLVGSFLFITKN
jgi:hypothetical protein